ncbi:MULTISPECIES: hypothetical protein [Methanothermococcus]|jgi:hypothetical protein|uniref:hypothetical protein n=1 Tax=Methanothermococcus TaxID=155862 RepID=UPI0003744554|nr:MULTISPECIES: hypothetical protein [Methanothermococcus]
MDSKEMVKRILNDIYKNLDEYSKDLIMANMVDVEFKGFNLIDDENRRFSMRNLDDCEHIPSFEAQNRKYKLRKVNLKNIDNGLLTIHLSSRKSDNYSFELDSSFEVVNPSSGINYEHRERMLRWTELNDEELDKRLEEFDLMADSIVYQLLENSTVKKEFLVYIDVFMNLENIKTVVEKEGDRVIIWIHPVFLFSSDRVIKGIIAHEISKYDKNVLETNYRDIIEYCKEYKKLCNKNLKVLKKIKEIVSKRNDKKSMEEIKEIESI